MRAFSFGTASWILRWEGVCMSIWWCNPAGRVSSGPIQWLISLRTAIGAAEALQKFLSPITQTLFSFTFLYKAMALAAAEGGRSLGNGGTLAPDLDCVLSRTSISISFISCSLVPERLPWDLWTTSSPQFRREFPGTTLKKTINLSVFKPDAFSIFFISPDNLSSRPSSRSHKLDLSHNPSCSTGRLRHRDMESFLRGECQW